MLAGSYELETDDRRQPPAAPLRWLSRLSDRTVADRAEPLSRARGARAGAGDHGGRLLRLAGVAGSDLRRRAGRAVRGAQRRQPGAALFAGWPLSRRLGRARIWRDGAAREASGRAGTRALRRHPGLCQQRAERRLHRQMDLAPGAGSGFRARPQGGRRLSQAARTGFAEAVARQPQELSLCPRCKRKQRADTVRRLFRRRDRRAVGARARVRTVHRRRARLIVVTAGERDIWLAGVGGCPTGWVVAFARADLQEARARLLTRFIDVPAAAEAPAIIAVDIPIVLPERAGYGGRAAENAVRPLLGARQSSVFSVPSRSAIAADDYREACHIALLTSEPPRKVSKQLFMLAPKIREVDTALRADATLAQRVFEVHPELAFWRLNGEAALSEPKKVKSRPYEPGLALRRKLLARAGLAAEVVGASPPKGAGPDDLIDALACAAIARRIHAGVARPFPDPPEHDALGLTMAIWA